MSRAVLVAALGVGVLAGCSSGGTVTALHDLHRSAKSDFYDLPFPSDTHLLAAGTIDLGLYKRINTLIGQYVDTIAMVEHGFGLSAGTFFRFDGAIDPSTLPGDFAASLQPSSPVYLVDITPGSPTYDQRIPVTARFTAAAYEFIGANWLGVIPQPGLPLREGTHYACVLTDGIKGVGGKKLVRAHDFDAAIAKNASSSSDPQIAAAGKAYAPFAAWLAAHPDIAPHVVNAAIFTTANESVVMKKLRDAVYAQAPMPVLSNLKYDGEDMPGVDYLYEGTYNGPNFQSGTSPYLGSGGQIVYDANGVPQMDHVEQALRISITVPEGDMPAAGWPVVIYQHGTGGNYMDLISKAHHGDGSAAELASVTASDGSVIARLAMIGTDEVLHGTRSPPSTNYDIAYFNFQNPLAVHDNPHQGALDAFTVVRLLHDIDVAAAPTTGKPIKFDTSKIYFKGHSQGGLQGPLFLAAEPEVKAAVLSGAGGGLIYSILNKKSPNDIPAIVQLFFDDPIDAYHPFLNLLQGYFDDEDPLTYARRLFAEPFEGIAPKSIYQSLGLIDTFTPIVNLEALALAMGVQPEGTQLQAIDGLGFTSIKWGTPPASDNVAGGKATGVLCEYQTTMNEDGHFVVFDEPAAIAQSNRFLATHAASGTSRLDPP